MMANLVDDLRQERCGRTVPYSQFLDTYRKDKAEVVYGFVEAREDISLYYSCIYPEIPQNGVICLIPCSGKYNVRDTYNLIDWTTHSKLRVCFFRDRDLSDYVADDNEMREYDNCYYTDGYSIENSLITETLLRRLLREVLGYHSATSEVLDDIVGRFVMHKQEFEDQFKSVMAHIIYWKKNQIKSPLNEISIKDVVNIGKDYVVYKSEADILSYVYKKAKVDIAACDIGEISKIELQISKHEQFRSIIRGHFLSEFFIRYCNVIKRCSNDLSVKLDVNNILAPRCEKIQSLSEFIKNTYCKYFKSIGYI